MLFKCTVTSQAMTYRYGISYHISYYLVLFMKYNVYDKFSIHSQMVVMSSYIIIFF